MTGGQAVVQWMASVGIRHFFNVPGESFLPVLDTLYDRADIRIVTHRHEAGAAFAAEAYSRVLGLPSVCMATRAPGASNLSIGVQTATYHATPLIALIALTPTNRDGSRAFQEFDVESLFGSISKRVLVARNVEALPAVLRQAHGIATSGRPGAVVVGLPQDVLYSEFSGGEGSAPLSYPSIPVVPSPEPLLTRILAADRPVILVGSDGGKRVVGLELLAEKLGLPAVCSYRRFAAFDNQHPNYVGSIKSPTDGKLVSFLEDSDLVLCIGFGLDPITTRTAALDRSGLSILHLAAAPDPDWARHADRANVENIVADPNETIAALLRHLELNPGEAEAARERFAKRTEGGRETVRTHAQGTSILDGSLTRAVMTYLEEHLSSEAIVTSDAGDFAKVLNSTMTMAAGRDFLAPINGAMGYGLPTAIGAELAAPGRPACCVAGDGGFLMLAGEMETAVRLGLRTLAVVINNRSYGTIRTAQEDQYGRTTGVDLGEVAFAQVASGFGWTSWTVATGAQLPEVFGEALKAGGCRLVEVCV